MPDTERKSLLAPELRELLQEGRVADLGAVLADLHPNDAAQQLAGLTGDEIIAVMGKLELPLARDLFTYFDANLQESIVVGAGRDWVKALLSALSSDDRAEFIDHLDERVRDQVFPLLSRVAREDLVRREQFADDQVGSVMSTEYCVLDRKLRAPQALEALRRQAPSRETIYYSYVVDDAGKLVGFLSLRDLIMARSHQTVGEIMKQTEVLAVAVTADQQQAAEMIREYDLLALPVVDAEGRLVGLVTHDDAVDILEAEDTEDVERMAGLTGESVAASYLDETVLSQVRRRAPLIVFLAVFGLVTASVIQDHEDTLKGHSGVLLALMPLVMAIGGMVGTQASSLVIRALAVGGLEHRAIGPVLWKELRVAGILAAILSCVAFGQAWVLEDAEQTAQVVRVGQAVGLAMLAHVLSAALVGAAMPMAVRAMRGDPALFSTPAVTAIADLSGAAIYLFVASALLRR